MSTRRKPRGFSLVELMVASAIVLIVFAGATWGAVQLHRRGNFEEAVADLQDVARGSRELVAPRIERAGAGMGNLMLTVGAAGAAADMRPSFSVTTAALPGPPAPYAALTSDRIDLFWGEPSSAMQVVKPCGASASAREANDVCVQRLPVAGSPGEVNVNDFVALVNPAGAVATACLYKVAAVSVGIPNRISLVAGQWGNLAPGGVSPCALNVGPFWMLPDLYVVKVGGASFQIAWSAGPEFVPTLEYDPDGWWDTRATWQPVAANVERLRVRVGLVSRDLLNPSPVPPAAPLAPPPILWFPDNTVLPVARPAIDLCLALTPSCVLTAAAGSNSDPNFPDKLETPAPGPDGQLALLMSGASADAIMQAQLMRRARIIELDLTVRSPRKDLALERPLGPGWAVDLVGNPLDGRNRRHYEMRVSLRNYGYEGS